MVKARQWVLAVAGLSLEMVSSWLLARSKSIHALGRFEFDDGEKQEREACKIVGMTKFMLPEFFYREIFSPISSVRPGLGASWPINDEC